MTEFIAHLHPVLVHLPIGILLLAAFFQLLSANKKFAGLSSAISITLLLGMFSAIAACITGYLLSGSGDYDETLVGQHQWLGIATALIAIIYYFLYQQKKRGLVVEKALPVLLILSVAITGHLGGSLTHGSDYLSGSFTHKETDTASAEAKPIADVQQAVVYAEIIQPMLQSKCNKCHGPNKQKGKLRMDQPDLLMKGGKDGVVLQPGKADESELYTRILLDRSDEHHMPPKEKPQLTEKEIALLHWWIASGASFTQKVKDIVQPEKIKPVLLSLQQAAGSEKKMVSDVPSVPVERASENAIDQLKNKGVVVIPVAGNSNYLSVSFVAASSANDKDMALLLPLKKQLVWLKLSDTKITDAAADIITQCNNISRLQLDSTHITDKGVARLSALTQLQVLNLVGTAVTAKGLLVLQKLPALRAVYVYRTGIKTTDWQLIAKAFPAARIDTGGYIVPLFESDTSLVKPPKLPVVK